MESPYLERLRRHLGIYRAGKEASPIQSPSQGATQPQATHRHTQGLSPQGLQKDSWIGAHSGAQSNIQDSFAHPSGEVRRGEIQNRAVEGRERGNGGVQGGGYEGTQGDGSTQSDGANQGKARQLRTRKRVMYVPALTKKCEIDKQAPQRLGVDEVCFINKNMEFSKEYLLKGDFMVRNVSLPFHIKGDFGHKLIYYHALNESCEWNGIQVVLDAKQEIREKRQKILKDSLVFGDEVFGDFVLRRLFEQRLLREIMVASDVWRTGQGNLVSAARRNFSFGNLGGEFLSKVSKLGILGCAAVFGILLFPYVLLCLIFRKAEEVQCEMQFSSLTKEQLRTQSQTRRHFLSQMLAKIQSQTWGRLARLKGKVLLALKTALGPLDFCQAIWRNKPFAEFILENTDKKSIEAKDFWTLIRDTLMFSPNFFLFSSVANLGLRLFHRIPGVPWLPLREKNLLLGIGIRGYYANIDSFTHRYWTQMYYPFLETKSYPKYIFDGRFRRDLMGKKCGKMNSFNVGCVFDVTKGNLTKKVAKPMRHFAFADQHYFLPTSLRIKILRDIAKACQRVDSVLVVETHPLDKNNMDYPFLEELFSKSDNLVFTNRHQRINRWGSAEAMISVYSTTLFEAVFSPLPAVSYNYADEELPQISNGYDFGLWFDVRNSDSLAVVLEDILRKGPLFRSQMRDRQKFFETYPYYADGKAETRLKKVCERLG